MGVPSTSLRMTAEYDVYGAPRASTQSGTPTSSQGYVGQLGHMTDSETGGLIYMQARYYDPTTGRFVSEDPKGNGNNWMIYCSGDPVNQYDTDGQVDSSAVQDGAYFLMSFITSDLFRM